jgi:hypothetical protein
MKRVSGKWEIGPALERKNHAFRFFLFKSEKPDGNNMDRFFKEIEERDFLEEYRPNLPFSRNR